MAFKTRCPSCGTLFWAPDNLLGTQISCPRCKSGFVAEKGHAAPLPSEEPLEAGGPVSVEGQFFCPVCKIGFTEDDILDGIAVRRFNEENEPEVYCLKHFQRKFSNECEKHPGVQAAARCTRCDRPLCENCVVELQEQKLCSVCKMKLLGELRGDHVPAEEFEYAERPGLPWERGEETFLGGMFATVGAVLFTPGYAFGRMLVRGGFGRPLLFVWPLSSAGVFLFYLSYLWIFGVAAMGAPEFEGEAGAAILFFMVMVLIMSMFASLLGPFIQAAVYHVCLMMVGDVREDYECTYRVVAYVSGSTAVLYVIPVVGIYIGGFWAIVAAIIGLARAHKVSGGKAALAVLLPTVLCGGLVVISAVMFQAA